MAVQDQQSSAEGFLQTGSWKLPVLADPGGTIANSYGIQGVPTTVFIDKDGNIASSKVGYSTADELKAATDALR